MLVLTPTRELAQQVHDVLRALGGALHLRTVCVYGGVGIERQAKALRLLDETVVDPLGVTIHVGCILARRGLSELEDDSVTR